MAGLRKGYDELLHTISIFDSPKVPGLDLVLKDLHLTIRFNYFGIVDHPEHFAFTPAGVNGVRRGGRHWAGCACGGQR